MINPQQFCFLFTFLFCILYYITLIVIQVNDHNMVVHPFSSACQIFSYASHPNFALAAQKDESPFTFKIFKVTNENCNDYGIQGKWTIKYRPIVGDHIHLGISIRENNVDLTLRDRKLVENIPYEDRIFQMKAPDYIKSKAIEKLKEVSSSKDSIKATNYLDGILKKYRENYYVY